MRRPREMTWIAKLDQRKRVRVRVTIEELDGPPSDEESDTECHTKGESCAHSTTYGIVRSRTITRSHGEGTAGLNM
jgi:hypothetical protein